MASNVSANQSISGGVKSNSGGRRMVSSAVLSPLAHGVVTVTNDDECQTSVTPTMTTMTATATLHKLPARSQTPVMPQSEPLSQVAFVDSAPSAPVPKSRSAAPVRAAAAANRPDPWKLTAPPRPSFVYTTITTNHDCNDSTLTTWHASLPRMAKQPVVDYCNQQRMNNQVSIMLPRSLLVLASLSVCLSTLSMSGFTALLCLIASEGTVLFACCGPQGFSRKRSPYRSRLASKKRNRGRRIWHAEEKRNATGIGRVVAARFANFDIDAWLCVLCGWCAVGCSCVARGYTVQAANVCDVGHRHRLYVDAAAAGDGEAEAGRPSHDDAGVVPQRGETTSGLQSWIDSVSHGAEHSSAQIVSLPRRNLSAPLSVPVLPTTTRRVVHSQLTTKTATTNSTLETTAIAIWRVAFFCPLFLPVG